MHLDERLVVTLQNCNMYCIKIKYSDITNLKGNENKFGQIYTVLYSFNLLFSRNEIINLVEVNALTSMKYTLLLPKF